ncbi:MAG: DUF4387 domain-containing protein [Proteobacteria bacterium]|nr:DUF4387 domain-containing protein [Pseudomonadota bacterium]
MKKLKDLAKVIRSKNSGPYEITFDVMFSDLKIYKQVKNSGILTREHICKLYSIDPIDIVTFMFFDPALAFKATLRRTSSNAQGSIGERDTFGTQQHVPLLDIEIP